MYSRLHHASIDEATAGRNDGSRSTTTHNETTNTANQSTEYDSTTLSPSCDPKEALLPDIDETAYDYIPRDAEDDEYDYECPYWEPADKKNQLLSQFRKLRLPSVAQKELE